MREAAAKDQPEIKRLIFGVLREYGLKPDSNTTDIDLDDIETYYFKNGGYFGVVVENNAVVATVGIYKVDDFTCELRKMYSAPSQRGKGLGKKLVEFSLSKARELGFKRITLETASPLIEAIGLYKRFGFKEYQPSHLAARCDQAFELIL
jgi:putative acetyltransferase